MTEMPGTVRGGAPAGAAGGEPVRRDAPRAWAAGLAIAAALLAFAALDPSQGSPGFFLLLGSASLGYLAALALIARGLRVSGRALLALALLALAWRIPLVLAPTRPYDDVKRYVWDARVVRAGQSPYAVIPADPAAAHLRTPESWPVNNRAVQSPYPPGAQLFFLAATAASESARAVKVALLLCEAVLALALWRWLAAIGARPAWLLAYLWNPLVAFEVARQGHVDAVGATWLVLAALALARGRTLWGALAFAMAVAVKPLPVVLAPLLWRRVRARDAAAGLAAFAALHVPFSLGGVLPVGSIPEVIERFRFNGPAFEAVASLAGPGVAAAVAVGAGLAVAAWARRRLPVTSPVAWAAPLAAALAFAPLVYPWYLAWLAPFLAGTATLPFAAWTVSIQSVYVVWHLAPRGARWAVPGWALLVEYGIVAALAAWIWRRRGADR